MSGSDLADESGCCGRRQTKRGMLTVIIVVTHLVSNVVSWGIDSGLVELLRIGVS